MAFSYKSICFCLKKNNNKKPHFTCVILEKFVPEYLLCVTELKEMFCYVAMQKSETLETWNSSLDDQLD